LYVADFYNRRIQMFSGKGSSLRKWGQKSTGIMQFDGPTDITVDQQGRAYVADWGNHRLQVFQIPEIK
jgi:DNA-binding beta-propeller fold protein YncE